MINATAKRPPRASRASTDSPGQQTEPLNFEASLWLPDHGNREGASTRTATTPKTRSKGNSLPSRDWSKGYRASETNSNDSAFSLPARNPNVMDWNDRRRRGLSGSKSSRSSTQHVVDPPRPASEGMEWVWFPEGYWAERERGDFREKKGESPTRWSNRPAGRKTSSARKTPPKTASSSRTNHTPHTQVGIHRIRSYASGTSRMSDAETRLEKLRLGFSFMSPTYPHFISPSGDLEGLYCKTKRNLSDWMVPQRKLSTYYASPTAASLTSPTTILLEGASSYFEQSQREHSQRMRGHLEAASPISPASPGPRPRSFGLAPWHRKTSLESLFSVTSSVRKLLQGKPPAATPDSVSLHFAPEEQGYPKADISANDPHAPNFLPSEARRINTPPMSPATPDLLVPRGFFFTLTAPGRERKSYAGSHSTKSEGKSQAGSHSPTGSSGDPIAPQSSSSAYTPTSMTREWWEIDPKHPLIPGKSIEKPMSKYNRGPPLMGVFDADPPPISPSELNIPEHLPNSPLCPKNPRYIGKGTVVCVYHG